MTPCIHLSNIKIPSLDIVSLTYSTSINSNLHLVALRKRLFILDLNRLKTSLSLAKNYHPNTSRIM